MTTTRKAIVTRDRVVHTYAELWYASECVLQLGERERTGSSFQFLSSIILTAFSLEAFLNHVGPTVLSSWGRLERVSWRAKLDLLCELSPNYDIAMYLAQATGSCIITDNSFRWQ